MRSLVNSVQFIEHTFSSTDTQTYVTLSSGTVIDNCVPFVSWYGNTDYPSAQFFDIWFEDSDNDPRIYFQRTETRSTSLYLKVNVVEFDSTKVKVYQGELPTLIGNDPETTTTVSGGPFDRSKSALKFYHRTTSTNDHFNYHLCRGSLTTYSGTYGEDVTFKRYHGTDTDIFGHYYIFESISEDFTVRHYSSSLENITSVGINTGYYDSHNSFLLSSYCGDDSSSGDVDQSAIRSYLWGEGQLRIDKYDYSSIVWYNTQLISFDNDATSSGTYYCPKIVNFYSMGTDTTELEYPMALPVPNDATMITVQNPSKCTTEVLGGQSSAFVAAWLTVSGTKYKLKRASSGYVVYPTYYIVDWGGNIVPKYTSTGVVSDNLNPLLTPVKSVENISLLTDSNLYINKTTLSKGQDVNNCVIFKSGKSNQTGDWNLQYNNQFSAYFRGNELWFERGHYMYSFNAEFSVVEFYPDQVKVQKGNFIIDANATSATITIDEVDTSKTFIVFNHFWGEAVDEWGYQQILGRFDSSTTLVFSRGHSSIYPVNGYWYVVEDLGDVWQVQHWNSSPSTTSSVAALEWSTHYSPYNTFNIMSNEVNYNTDNPDDCLWTVYYHSPLSPARCDKAASGYANTLNVQVIRFLNDERARVNFNNKFFRDNESSLTFDLPDEMATSSGISIVWCTSNGTGYVYGDTANYIPHAYPRIQYLPDTNQVNFTRNYSGSINKSGGAMYTIDWEGYIKRSGNFEYEQLGHFVKSIEHVTYKGASSRVIKTLTKNQDITNCIPIPNWSISEDLGVDPERFSYGIYMLPEIDALMLQSYWAANDPGIDIDVAVVEFDPAQVKVQHGTSHISNGNTNTVAAIEEVDTSKAFIMVYMLPSDSVGSNFGAVYTSAKFNSSTELFFERYSSTGNIHLTWFVVECLQDQWQVDHSTITNSNQSYYDFDFSNYSPIDKTISVASFSSAYTSDDPDHNFYRMYPEYDRRGVYRIRVNRQNSGYNCTMHCSKIAFAEDSGVMVTTLHYYFGTSEYSKTYDIGRTVNPNKTIVFNGLSWNTMRINNTSTASTQRGFAKATIQDANTLLVERSDDPYSVEGWGHVYIIEFDIPTHKVSGVVREKGGFVDRDLRLHSTATGELLSSTTSSSADGTYSMVTSHSGSSYVVCFDAPGGTVYNGLIETDIYPTAVSGTFPYEEGWL